MVAGLKDGLGELGFAEGKQYVLEIRDVKGDPGVSSYEVGRLSAKYVQRILAGKSPRDLLAESLSKVGLAINLKTARELGITVPQSLLPRADEVIR